MNFTETEFSSVTDKLERYASELSSLQTRLDAQKEINDMMAIINNKEKELLEVKHELEIERRRRWAVEQSLAKKDEENTHLKAAYEQVKAERDKLRVDLGSESAKLAYLMDCIMISVSGVKSFFRIVKQINSKALLHTFLIKTVSPEMGPRALEVINEATDMDTGIEGKIADQIIFDNTGTVEHQ
jgi:DNA repair exonuclease SbcCD ATPase subunit